MAVGTEGEEVGEIELVVVVLVVVLGSIIRVNERRVAKSSNQLRVRIVCHLGRALSTLHIARASPQPMHGVQGSTARVRPAVWGQHTRLG